MGDSLKKQAVDAARLGRSYLLASLDQEAELTYILTHPTVRDLMKRGEILASHILSAAEANLILVDHPEEDADCLVVAQEGKVDSTSHDKWTASFLYEVGKHFLKMSSALVKEGMDVTDPFSLASVDGKICLRDLSKLVLRKPEKEPWAGFTPFHQKVLIPLILNRYFNRSLADTFKQWPNGISAMEATEYCRGVLRYAPTVISYVIFPALLERKSKVQSMKGVSNREATLMATALVKQFERALDRVRPKGMK